MVDATTLPPSAEALAFFDKHGIAVNATNVNLSGKEITGFELPHLQYLPNLRKLDLSKNHIETKDLSHLAQLKGLEEIDLSNNWISLESPKGSISQLFDLPNLEKIKLISNEGPESDSNSIPQKVLSVAEQQKNKAQRVAVPMADLLDALKVASGTDSPFGTRLLNELGEETTRTGGFVTKAGLKTAFGATTGHESGAGLRLLSQLQNKWNFKN